MKEKRIVFMGTPSFAVPALEALHSSFTVLAVVTQPDRPSGRGKKMTPPPARVAAETLGIPVLQPTKIKTDDFSDQLISLAPDFIVTCAYGRILPKKILEIPTVTALNIHASLLPRWRGAAPIHRAVMAGDKESGVTIIHMDEGMDTGDMVLRRAVSVRPDDTTGDLHDRLSLLGGEMVVDAVHSILNGTAERIPQDESEATAAPVLQREEERIDWCSSAQDIHNLVRGMNPWPGAYTLLNGNRLKVWRGCPVNGKAPSCGEVISAEGEGILVAAQNGAFRITELQPPGKKAMSAADFLRGRPLPAGTRLGK
ncbi:MAG: methionyl-tRNA formyltransferase [Bacillota bacterium]|nr:methionyl-tRNA formyltransferase [Bacillota bacterium]MDW7682587.1 methionyl-tRNA formyltransferase [Bacillota bacterium]